MSGAPPAPAAPAPEPARPADLDAVRALLAAAALPADDVDAPMLAHFVVIRASGGIAGVAGVEPCGRDGLLRSLAVAEEARGTGLGQALVAAVEARARALGLRSLYLLTTTAAAFFAARGYRPAGRDTAPEAVRRTREFSALCPASAALMVRHLD